MGQQRSRGCVCDVCSSAARRELRFVIFVLYAHLKLDFTHNAASASMAGALCITGRWIQVDRLLVLQTSVASAPACSHCSLPRPHFLHTGPRARVQLLRACLWYARPPLLFVVFCVTASCVHPLSAHLFYVLCLHPSTFTSDAETSTNSSFFPSPQDKRAQDAPTPCTATAPLANLGSSR